MADQQRKIKITDSRHVAKIGELYGLAVAVEALKEREELLQKLPGFCAALAIVEKHLADTRTQTAILNMRAAAKAGIDLTTWTVKTASFSEIACEPLDLVELAEQGG